MSLNSVHFLLFWFHTSSRLVLLHSSFSFTFWLWSVLPSRFFQRLSPSGPSSLSFCSIRPSRLVPAGETQGSLAEILLLICASNHSDRHTCRLQKVSWKTCKLSPCWPQKRKTQELLPDTCYIKDFHLSYLLVISDFLHNLTSRAETIYFLKINEYLIRVGHTVYNV